MVVSLGSIAGIENLNLSGSTQAILETNSLSVSNSSLNQHVHNDLSNVFSSVNSWFQSHSSSINLDSVIGSIVSNQTISGDSSDNTIGIIGNNNVINAGSGDDRVGVVGDSNTLNGEVGADILAAVGASNFLRAGSGNDFLKADGGNNTLNGGEGRDIFGLPDIVRQSNNSIQGQSTIQDFEKGVDKLGLPTLATFNGTSSSFRVVNFNELTVANQGQNTAISYQGTVLAILEGIQSNEISATDFVKSPNIDLPIL